MLDFELRQPKNCVSQKMLLYIDKKLMKNIIVALI